MLNEENDNRKYKVSAILYYDDDLKNNIDSLDLKKFKTEDDAINYLDELKIRESTFGAEFEIKQLNYENERLKIEIEVLKNLFCHIIENINLK